MKYPRCIHFNVARFSWYGHLSISSESCTSDVVSLHYKIKCGCFYILLEKIHMSFVRKSVI